MESKVLLFLLLLLAIACTPAGKQQLDLSGEWSFQMDPDDLGIPEQWFEKSLSDVIILPGSMVGNGKGEDVTLGSKWTGGKKENWFNDPLYKDYVDSSNVRIPFWLQPDKKYLGAAWYQKEVNIPASWKEKQMFLNLERCHWKTDVWVNSVKVGTQNSLSAAHQYDITKFLEKGSNTITICVDNRTHEMDPGENSHSISDHTQGNWNGMVGDLSIQAHDRIHIGRIKITPDITTKSVIVEAEVINQNETQSTIDFSIWASGKNFEKPAEMFLNEKLIVENGTNSVKFLCALGEDAFLWDEYNPYVYELTVKIVGKKILDLKTSLFGLREFKAEGTRFAVNGHPVFLRGTLECAIFPKTGYPSTDVEEWSRIFQICKDHGLNHMRFHSWCPPEAAFEAADMAGIYLQVECASWANQSTTLGDGESIDEYIYQESERIVDQYGNHPSFCMMAYGNEPGGNHIPYLKKFVNYWKERDSRRVYTAAAGWPLIPENDFHSSYENVRIQEWGAGLTSIINSKPPATDYDWSKGIQEYDIPMVSHEIGQWCVYPDFKEIEKYTGPLKAKNFELFRDKLTDKGLGEYAEPFLMASGKLQALCYKADIEAALRTPGFGGFQLLDLHDFPGQGTALVGVLNPFWEEKGYITAAEFKRFCGETVPLARMERLIYSNAESFYATIEVAHFGASELDQVKPEWKIFDTNGLILNQGSLGISDIPIGNNIHLGEIAFPLNGFTEAIQLKLEVTVGEASNDWDFWVYPEHHKENLNTTVHISQTLDPQTIEILEKGGSVLLTPKKGSVNEAHGGEIGVGFSSIFWNTSWTGGQKPHTLGILCDPEHPALAHFPTQTHSNWQWWDAMSHSNAIVLDNLSPGLKPIVRIIDDWVTSRSLAMFFEVKVGKGKMIVSGVDFLENQEKRLESKQLMYSLLSYMNSPDFDPEIQMPVEEISMVFN